ncbi:TetR/AcrR family transcriptional regulator [Jeotgalibacillus proteolyticus]|uniref:TetR/AcrR family transcriptional regulator n=1 Tax=Jeotgalibacillus proteolyticus TaxID=2082395 RepID=A0A2S5GBX7_9BACL|nr:TetR/AcrR family transcriptional regulator [Jeotgalibacillus proteolyticus]PPA70458.1 TetR/AcrR family transcriptional regulator [Jeotgalibacillus proteolyticus]
MKKNPPITELTKQNLNDAFWELYCTKRIEKITIKEITMKAGYNRSTFYEYFSDVYDVLEQIEDQLISKLQELPLKQLSPQTDSFPLEALVKIFSKHGHVLGILLGDQGDPAFQGKIKASMRPMIKEVLLAQGAIDDFELEYTLEYALSAMIGVLSYWFGQDEKSPSIEELVKLLTELSERGIIKKLKGEE